MIVNFGNLSVIDPGYITVKREASDKRPSDESHFFYQLCQHLKKNHSSYGPWAKLGCKSYANGRYTQAVPGLNDIPYSVRRGTKNAKLTYLIYDNYYRVRDVAKDFWNGEEVHLSIFWPNDDRN